MTELVLCETAADVQGAAPAVDAGARLIALAPDAWYAAVTRYGHAEMLEDFYDERALNDLREPVLAAQLAWMDHLDAVIARHVPAVAAHELQVSRLWFFCLKHLLDPPVMLGFMLQGLFDRTQPAVVHFPDRVAAEHAWPRFFRIRPHERIESPHGNPIAVAEAMAVSRGVEIRRVPVPSGGLEAPRSGAIRPRGARTWVRRHAPGWAIDLLGSAQRSGLRGVRDLLRARTASGPRLLVVRSEFDLALLVAEAARRGCRLDFWSRVESAASGTWSGDPLLEDIDRQVSAAWAELDASEAFRAPLVVHGADAYPMIRGALEYFVTRTIPQAVEYYLLARSALAGGRYRAALAPGGAKGTMLFAAARAEGIPIVMYQHGGFVGPCEMLMWDFADFLHSDLFIAYGSGVANYIDGRRAKLPRMPAVCPAGSASLEARLDALRGRDVSALRHKLAGGLDRVVTYVASLVRGYSRVLVAASYPDTLAFKRQLEIVRLTKAFPDVAFVFKLYGNREDRLFREMLAAHGGSNCRVVTDMPLLDVMAASDAIAVEFPSTALLEAATLDKPLVVFADADMLRLQPEAAALLRARGALAESYPAFLEDLGRLARGEVPPPGGVDKEGFTRAFAIDRSSSPAVQRAWQAVADVCASRA